MENSHSSRPCKCPLTSLAAPDSGSQTNASKELPWYPGTHQSTSQAPMSSQCLPYPSVSPSQMASALQREMCPGELQWTPAGKCLPCVSLRGTPCDWLLRDYPTEGPSALVKYTGQMSCPQEPLQVWGLPVGCEVDMRKPWRRACQALPLLVIRWAMIEAAFPDPACKAKLRPSGWRV